MKYYEDLKVKYYQLKNNVKANIKGYTICLVVGAVSSGLIISYLKNSEFKSELNEIRNFAGDKGWKIEREIFESEGFEFTPGGGYWFYPKGMTKLTQYERSIIEKRIDYKMENLKKPLNDVRDSLEVLMGSYE